MATTKREKVVTILKALYNVSDLEVEDRIVAYKTSPIQKEFNRMMRHGEESFDGSYILALKILNQ